MQCCPGAVKLFEPCPGIGDQVYFQFGGILQVLNVKNYIVVNSRVYPKEEATESAIARKIVAKLK